jgi:hypothetical protein
LLRLSSFVLFYLSDIFNITTATMTTKERKKLLKTKKITMLKIYFTYVLFLLLFFTFPPFFQYFFSLTHFLYVREDQTITSSFSSPRFGLEMYKKLCLMVYIWRLKKLLFLLFLRNSSQKNTVKKWLLIWKSSKFFFSKELIWI